ncbi:MAG TPA: hypothetical protein VF252_13865 [Gemmatimonadales bacterium]
MTTLLLAAPTLVHEARPKSLDDSLRVVHARRLRELREALEPAQGPEAGVWSRWSAVRLLDHLLSAWFEPERKLIEEEYHMLESGHAARLWTAAELVTALHWQIAHSVGLCHHPAEFCRITLKLETVLEHWCDEVEDAVGSVDWQDLSGEEHQALVSAVEEEPTYVT